MYQQMFSKLLSKKCSNILNLSRYMGFIFAAFKLYIVDKIIILIFDGLSKEKMKVIVGI